MAHDRTPIASPRKATTFQLVFMTYAVICSGAYGLEQMVSSSGPGMAILSLAILPLVWAAPIALACAELSSRFPVEGGYYRWARMAFGDFVGYLAGWLVWLAIFATNGMFAVLFANYLRYWIPDLSPLGHWMVALALVWSATFLNYRGIRLVGTTAVVLTILIFLPFLAMTFLGILRWRFNPVVPFVNPERGALMSFSNSLLLAVWLYSGYEKLTTNAGEVEAPSRAFPIALAFAVPMTALSYIVPTVVALAANGDWAAWGEAHFSKAAEAIGGTALGGAMTLGALLSNACLLMVTILGQSRLPMVLAEDGLLPDLFRKTHPRFGTPVISLLLGGVVMSLLSLFSFSYLTGLFSLVQVFAYLLIYAALFRLRSRAPVTTRGLAAPAQGAKHRGDFRIPLGTGGLALMTIPSVLLAALVVVQSLWPEEGFNGAQALVLFLLVVSGPLSYLGFGRIRRAGPRPVLGPGDAPVGAGPSGPNPEAGISPEGTRHGR
jgi:amino acid transporter